MENEEVEKMASILLSELDDKELAKIKNIKFIFSFKYDEDKYKVLINNIRNNIKLSEKTNNLTYSVMDDNVLIFTGEGVDQKKYVLSVFDPFEVWDSEVILDIIPLSNSSKLDFFLN